MYQTVHRNRSTLSIKQTSVASNRYNRFFFFFFTHIFYFRIIMIRESFFNYKLNLYVCMYVCLFCSRFRLYATRFDAVFYVSKIGWSKCGHPKKNYLVTRTFKEIRPESVSERRRVCVYVNGCFETNSKDRYLG